MTEQGQEMLHKELAQSLLDMNYIHQNIKPLKIWRVKYKCISIRIRIPFLQVLHSNFLDFKNLDFMQIA